MLSSRQLSARTIVLVALATVATWLFVGSVDAAEPAGKAYATWIVTLESGDDDELEVTAFAECLIFQNRKVRAIRLGRPRGSWSVTDDLGDRNRWEATFNDLDDVGDLMVYGLTETRGYRSTIAGTALGEDDSGPFSVAIAGKEVSKKECRQFVRDNSDDDD